MSRPQAMLFSCLGKTPPVCELWSGRDSGERSGQRMDTLGPLGMNGTENWDKLYTAEFLQQIAHRFSGVQYISSRLSQSVSDSYIERTHRTVHRECAICQCPVFLQQAHSDAVTRDFRRRSCKRDRS
jgi:hypothetical protein